MSEHNIAGLMQLLRLLRDKNYAHTAITPLSHQRVNQRFGNSRATDLAGIFGWNRAFALEDIATDVIDCMRAADILVKHGDLWRSQLRVASLNGQYFLHSAFPTDHEHAVFFGPDTYRFAAAIQQFLSQHQSPIKRAVDIGTGSGAGAILLAKALPQCAVLALDINASALTLAKVNVQAAQALNVQVAYSDLLQDVDGEFDLIIANPPYLVDATARAYRHGGGALGADLSIAIVDSAIARLAAGGSLLLYTGVAIVNGEDAFYLDVAQRLNGAGFHVKYHEIDPDIFGEELLREVYQTTDRLAAVLLTAQKPYASN